jgi:hypothetical protein
VTGSQRNTFKVVFEAAQKILRDMELVELQTRIATQETALGIGDGAKQKRGQGASQSQQNGATQQTQNDDTIMGIKKKGLLLFTTT